MTTFNEYLKSKSVHFTEPRRPIDYNAKQVAASIKKHGHVYISEKVDGCRLHLIVPTDMAQPCAIVSRANKTFPGLYELWEKLEFARARVPILSTTPGGVFTVECEVTIAGVDGNVLPCAEIAGLLRAHAGVPLNRVTLNVFDMYGSGSKRKGYDLSERIITCGNYKYDLMAELTRMTGIRVENKYPQRIFSMETLDSEFKYRTEYKGDEGVIITPANTPYVSGKKAGAGWKRKKQMTFDAVVKGFTEAIGEKDSQGKGMIGALICEVPGITEDVHVSAGAMSHVDRRHFFENPDQLLERLIEGTAMEATEGNKSLRHPTFTRFRDDLDNKGVKTV